VKLTRRTVATALGIALVALGASDAGFVVLTHAPWLSHLGSEVVPIGLGVGLLWWSRRPSTEESDATADRLPGALGSAELPDRASPIVAVTLGSVLLLIGAFLGLLFSIVFGVIRGIEAFVVPWGVAGGAAVAAGGYRLVSIALSERATDRALMAIARTVDASPGLAITGPAPSANAARLLGLHQEAVETVRRAYETALPRLRTGVWLGILLWPFVGAYVAWALVNGAAANGIPLPFAVDAALAAAAVLIAFTAEAQSVGRLRALELARVELAAGRSPADWSVSGRIPLRIIVGFLRHPLSEPPAPVTEPEDSLLASSLALLRFGRRLASAARGWHVGIFLFIWFGGTSASLLSAFILLRWLYGLSPPVPLIIAAEWGPALAFLAAAVIYLRRRFASIDEVSRRLGQLETAEVELARAFWSRF
jgi:hypothetical protein